jgi:hypothetical protein
MTLLAIRICLNGITARIAKPFRILFSSLPGTLESRSLFIRNPTSLKLFLESFKQQRENLPQTKEVSCKCSVIFQFYVFLTYTRSVVQNTVNVLCIFPPWIRNCYKRKPDCKNDSLDWFGHFLVMLQFFLMKEEIRNFHHFCRKATKLLQQFF